MLLKFYNYGATFYFLSALSLINLANLTSYVLNASVLIRNPVI